MKVELLAPAQNLQIAKSAVICGADAVYIGASSFGARKMAGNNLNDIEELVKFAHKFNVKIYVTLNTILNDRELKDAQKLIFNLYDIGVDAIIIQDMGLLEIELPKIELHASTQCNIKTLEKVKFFEEIGIKRAILARELSLEQIKHIKDNTDIELECFIHGALCVSYSGQCYMSAYIGGRSANRGECAQACRKKYSLLQEDGKIVEKDKYLLSLKDFCAENYLNKLIDIGVKSFKIEGRLKDENYVKNTVLYYNNLLQSFERTSSGKVFADFIPDLNKTFNRGYTDYFLSGKRSEIYNFKTPKSTGEYMGEVISSKDNCIKIKNPERFNPQDGVCFFENEKLQGALVNKIYQGKIYLNKKTNLKKGDLIYRNFDSLFDNVIKNSKTKRLIEVNATIYSNKIVVCDNKNKIEIKFETVKAENSNKMKENFEKSLKKTGNSIFQILNVEFRGDSIPFLPVSKINELRRESFQKLEELRIKNYKRADFKKTKYAKYKDLPKDYRLNIANKQAEIFYNKCSVENIEYAPEITNNFKGIELMRTKLCLRYAFNMCCKNERNYKGNLILQDEFMKKYFLKFDCKNCEMIIMR